MCSARSLRFADRRSAGARRLCSSASCAQLEIEYVPWLLSGVILYQYGNISAQDVPHVSRHTLGCAPRSRCPTATPKGFWRACCSVDCVLIGIFAAVLHQDLSRRRPFADSRPRRLRQLPAVSLAREHDDFSDRQRESSVRRRSRRSSSPSAPVAILALAAYAIARWVEPSMRAAIDHLGNSMLIDRFGHRPRLAERL